MSDNNTQQKPAPPKRPQCAFFIFKSEVYQQVKQENPGKKMTEITKLISEQYKLLPKEKIQEYENKYRESKTQFEKDKKEYEDKHGKIKNAKKEKKPGQGQTKPKKQPKKKGKKKDSEDGSDHDNASEENDDDEKD